MTLNRRFLRLRRLLKLVPRLLSHADVLEAFLPRLVALDAILGRLEGFDDRLKALDKALYRMEKIGKEEAQPVAVVTHSNGKHDYEEGRIKMLGKFVALAGKGREIELAWQKIQQDEHDAFFAFQIFQGRNEVDYAYKKGIADGVKWCVERFS